MAEYYMNLSGDSHTDGENKAPVTLAFSVQDEDESSCDSEGVGMFLETFEQSSVRISVALSSEMIEGKPCRISRSIP